jgi:hypothetical protein
MTFAQLQKIVSDHLGVAGKDQILLKPETGYNKLITVEAIEDQVFSQNHGFRS